jgi:hypothetical protein
MAKKQNQLNFYNLSQYEANCQTNKYLKALVLSHFCLTRDLDMLDGLKKIEDDNLWEGLYEEYKKYHAGEDIQIESEKQDLFDPSLMDTMLKDSSISVQ